MAKRKKRKKKSTVRGQSNAASGSEPSPAGTAEDVPAGEAEAAPLQPVPTTEPEAPGASLLGALGWACAVCVLGLTILAFLAALPAVSCPAGQEACGWGTGCVRVASDREHCGACGNVCEGECRFGRCETGD